MKQRYNTLLDPVDHEEGTLKQLDQKAGNPFSFFTVYWIKKRPDIPMHYFGSGAKHLVNNATGPTLIP